MANAPMFRSDLSGELVDKSDRAVVRVYFSNGEMFALDVTTSEAKELAKKGMKKNRRGRPRNTPGVPSSRGGTE